jgi:hypothetical protein
MASIANNSLITSSKQTDVAERLFDLFYSDATTYVEQRGGFKHIREDGKHVFDKPDETIMSLLQLST